ncbi:MAG: hypothetical protein ACYS8X_06830, partial [Planctomycetota bacterium]
MRYVRMCAIGLAVLAMLVSAAGAGEPFVSFTEELDWEQMSPIPDWMYSDLETANPGWTPPSGTYDEPFLDPIDTPDPLYVLESGEEMDTPGLIMAWGEPDGSDYTAAWEFVYPLDPDVRWQTISAALVAPQFTTTGTQMNSISLGLIDISGAARIWTWLCGATVGTNTITWNQTWNVTIGPIADFIPPNAPGPASATDGVATVAPLFFSNPLFDPSQVTTIIGLENGRTAAQAPVPPGGLPGMAMWNWWGNLVVTPEPTTMCLLGLG